MGKTKKASSTPSAASEDFGWKKTISAEDFSSNSSWNADLGGFFELEELDGAEISFEGDESLGRIVSCKKKVGKVAKTIPLHTDIKTLKRKREEEDDSAPAAATGGDGELLSDWVEISESDLAGYDESTNAKVSSSDQSSKLKNASKKQKKGDGESASAATDESSAHISTPGESAAPEKSKDRKAERQKKLKEKREKQKELKRQKKQGWVVEDKASSAASTTSAASATSQPSLTADDATIKVKSEAVAVAAVAAEPEVDISAWDEFGLHVSLLQTLKRLRFTKPTQIQEGVLPHAVRDGRDIVGAAETGSGKTLAFGLPMLNYIARRHEEKASTGEKDYEGISGLIMTPTRELAIQIKDHLEQFALATRARIVAIVGGMSVGKQERQLNQKPDIIIATPGRLWELITDGSYASLFTLKQIRFLAIDEADRMMEQGHFRELDSILRYISKKRLVEYDRYFSMEDVQPTSSNDDEVKIEDATSADVEEETATPAPPRQTFVFSATLAVPKHANKKGQQPVSKAKLSEQTVDALVERLEFDDPNPVTVDVTSEKITAAKLIETQIECLKDDKDLYLYYLLSSHPGRTLVFVNSIDQIRRLLPMLKLLNIQAYGLHAQMQQRARLKNLDRFKAGKNVVMVASDVASRGLDIPNVEHVIHYQVPRSTDIYVHRSGRTARAHNDGVSVMMISPEEVQYYRRICQSLNKQKLASFPVKRTTLEPLRKKIRDAKAVDKERHTSQKEKYEKDWLKKAAAALDVDVDEDMM